MTECNQSSFGFKACGRRAIVARFDVPSLLRKHTRSKGPFLRRHYPTSSVIWPSPTPRLVRRPFDDG